MCVSVWANTGVVYIFQSKYKINTVYLSSISSSVNAPGGGISGTEIGESWGGIIFNFKSRKWFMKYMGKSREWRMNLIY